MLISDTKHENVHRHLSTLMHAVVILIAELIFIFEVCSVFIDFLNGNVVLIGKRVFIENLMVALKSFTENKEENQGGLQLT